MKKWQRAWGLITIPCFNDPWDHFMRDPFSDFFPIVGISWVDRSCLCLWSKNLKIEKSPPKNGSVRNLVADKRGYEKNGIEKFSGQLLYEGLRQMTEDPIFLMAASITIRSVSGGKIHFEYQNSVWKIYRGANRKVILEKDKAIIIIPDCSKGPC